MINITHSISKEACVESRLLNRALAIQVYLLLYIYIYIYIQKLPFFTFLESPVDTFHICITVY